MNDAPKGSYPEGDYPHVRAAFINAISEEGTKAEAIAYLQKQWNECCALRAEIRRLTGVAQASPEARKAIDFCEWLQGFLYRIGGRDELDAFDANWIRNELNERVFPPTPAVPSADRGGK